MPFVKNKEAAKHFNVSDSTLRKWAREKLIKVEETKGGHWRYWIEPTPEVPRPPSPQVTLSDHIIYTRVSSKKQSRDLSAQSIFLKERFPNYTLISDIGSGINCNRKGFKTILEQLFQGNIKKVVVAHPDRFTRFSFDFFQWMFTHFGAVLDAMEKPNDNAGADFTTDLMEVLTVFTARYYGRRKYGLSPSFAYNRDPENQDLSDKESIESV